MSITFNKINHFLLFFLILPSHALFCQESTLNNGNSIILEADGYSYLSENKTMKEIRKEALINAKQEALEKGQSYICSNTKIENFKLVFDSIESQSEGYVKIIDSKDYGITTDNRYHYWIKAEINYLPIKENNVLNTDLPLTVEVWSSKEEYRQGENFTLFIKGNKNFFARILYIDSNGQILQLVPNQHKNKSLFHGSTVYQVPESSDIFHFEISPPFGKDQIILFASTAPQGNIQIEKYGSSFFKIDHSLDLVETQTRGIKIRKNANQIPVEEFYQTSIYIHTCE